MSEGNAGVGIGHALARQAAEKLRWYFGLRANT